MKNKPTDNNHTSGGSYPANFGCHIPIFFFKIAYPCNYPCNAYARALTLAGNVIEFALLFACYWQVKSMSL